MRHDSSIDCAATISQHFAAIYHRCHPTYSIALSHQAVRVLQLIDEEGPVTVQRVADFLSCASNTASELVSRLAAKKLVEKRRRPEDERTVHLILTSGGRTALREHVGLDVPHLAKALAAVDPEARQTLADAFERLLRLVSSDAGTTRR